MAAVAGTGASVTQGSVTMGMARWTVNDTIDMHDITTFADATIAKWLGGIKRWAGTFGGNWDIANTLDVGDGTTITCTMASGKTISGTILVTNMATSTDVQGVVTVEYSFNGNGTPTYS